MFANRIKPTKIDVNQKEDLNRLFALEDKAYKAYAPYGRIATPEDLRKFLTEEYKTDTWTLKGSQGNFMAYVSIEDRPKDETMEVVAVCVDPDLQHKGYGRQLMTFAEQKAIEKEREKVTLVTRKDNKHAISFYKSLGYKIVGTSTSSNVDKKPRWSLEKNLVGDSSLSKR